MCKKLDGLIQFDLNFKANHSSEFSAEPFVSEFDVQKEMDRF